MSADCVGSEAYLHISAASWGGITIDSPVTRLVQERELVHWLKPQMSTPRMYSGFSAANKLYQAWKCSADVQLFLCYASTRLLNLLSLPKSTSAYRTKARKSPTQGYLVHDPWKGGNRRAVHRLATSVLRLTALFESLIACLHTHYPNIRYFQSG
jgi:hypothetical protein